MNNEKKREILILILCLLIGFALRFYTFDQKSLWLDEIHTFNDSRDDIKEQYKFYKENPTYLHPPLFPILTHLFYPFTKPERDLRIIPLIFGTLSILMIYFLSKSFSPNIALPCALSLTFMAYHISLSQDGRSYAILMFFGMAGLYFFMKHLKTSKKRYLILVALFFSTLFYTSYSSIPFITLSQILWFYRPTEEAKKPFFSSFLILNGLLLLICLPWILFLAIHYEGQMIMDPYHTESPGSFWTILYGILHDWAPYTPLLIASALLLILFPFISKFKKNALVLLSVFALPIGGLYLYCKLFNITHFITSRYLINLLPIFLISLYLSLNSAELRFAELKKFLRPQILFLVLFIASNFIILPFYYQSEKQNLRGLVSYLKEQLQDGDKVFLGGIPFFTGVFHYFGIYPMARLYEFTLYRDSEKGIEFFMMPISDRNRTIRLYSSRTCCTQYVADGSRLWIVVGGKQAAKEIKRNSPTVLKGYFDGSFLNFNRFPTDASIYLFLWDPSSPDEKGIDMPID